MSEQAYRITYQHTCVRYCNDHYDFDHNDISFSTCSDAHLVVSDQNIYFTDLPKKVYTEEQSIIVEYQYLDTTITTTVTITECDTIQLEMNVNGENSIDKIVWPSTIQFEQYRKDWYTVLPLLQGYIIPNTHSVQVKQVSFDGQMCSAAAYMPWFGQIKEGHGYMIISETPYDSGYQIDHPANGPYTHICLKHLSSLGSFKETRKAILHFTQGSYVQMCQYYRQYVKQKGLLTTLQQKMNQLPEISKLIGSCVIHESIKKNVVLESKYYNREDDRMNHSLVSFETRKQELDYYHSIGVKKLYLHLDGWGQPGYDNCHPDYLPVCKEAGGYESLKQLVDSAKEYGYLIGLHDQYRDFYHSAKSFDPDKAVITKDGKPFEMCVWAGGRQSYISARFALDFVKRNFADLFEHGIHPTCSYLDVFTCNEPDESYHPHYPMSRKECLSNREECFKYLIDHQIIPSSEEMNDWAMKSIVFCHYAPYEFMLKQPGSERYGIAVPLFNLVYHDCVIIPWMMDVVENEDYMLYALLNGGIGYLEREGAYPNTDGAFSDERKQEIARKLDRCNVVSALHQRVAKLQMINHYFVNDDEKIQVSVFEDGTKVTVNFHDNTYQLEYEKFTL